MLGFRGTRWPSIPHSLPPEHRTEQKALGCSVLSVCFIVLNCDCSAEIISSNILPSTHYPSPPQPPTPLTPPQFHILILSIFKSLVHSLVDAYSKIHLFTCTHTGFSVLYSDKTPSANIGPFSRSHSLLSMQNLLFQKTGSS